MNIDKPRECEICGYDDVDDFRVCRIMRPADPPIVCGCCMYVWYDLSLTEPHQIKRASRQRREELENRS